MYSIYRLLNIDTFVMRSYNCRHTHKDSNNHHIQLILLLLDLLRDNRRLSIRLYLSS